MSKALLVMRYFIREEGENRIDYHPKFDDQISAFTELGYECTYFGISKEGELYQVVRDGKKYIASIRFNSIPILHHFTEYETLYRAAVNAVKKENYDFVYVRNCPTVPYYITAMKEFSKYCSRVVVEIPTHPAKKEAEKEKRAWIRALYPYMNYIENKSSKYVSLYTLIGEHEDTFHGIKAVNIFNGTNVDGYKKHQVRKKDGTIHMIALAGMAYYHGYDRIIKGLYEYYKQPNVTPFVLHLVGPDADGSLREWKDLTIKLGLERYVLFEGAMNGDALDEMFDKCDIACGAMALFRRNTNVDFDLKSAEYLSRGIPFICCKFSKTFNYKIPHCYSMIEADETPVDIAKVVHFFEQTSLSGNYTDEMRSYALEFSWKSQLRVVLSAVGL